MTSFSSLIAQEEQPKTIKKVSIKEVYIQRGFYKDKIEPSISSLAKYYSYETRKRSNFGKEMEALFPLS